MPDDSATPDRFTTTLGPECVRRPEAWELDLSTLPLLHGLSVLSRALAEMACERQRTPGADIRLERRLRPRENPELRRSFRVERIVVSFADAIVDAFTADPTAAESRLRTILGTLQRQRYWELLFARRPERRALVFEFEIPSGGTSVAARAVLELFRESPDGPSELGLTIEQVGIRNLDLSTVPHEVVTDVDRRHFVAGSTRIAQTWRDGLRREAERGHRCFVERRSVHGHLFRQLDRAQLGHVEQVEIRFGPAQVGLLLETEAEVLDRDLKRLLLALEDDRVRSLLAEGDVLRIGGESLSAYVRLMQQGRVLTLGLDALVESADVEEFLGRMPTLTALIDERASDRPLRGVDLLLIHHDTAEILGVIAGLRALGCDRLTVLFVSYSGETPGRYVEALLNLPSEEFRVFSLTQVPDERRTEGHFRMSRQFSDLGELVHLDAPLRSATTFFEAMRGVARRLFLESALQARSSGRELLLIEDGGYLAPGLHRAIRSGESVSGFGGRLLDGLESPEGDLSLESLCRGRFLGSVEHTRNGHDRLLEVGDDCGFAFPTASIAVARVKREVEAREVAASILQAVESVLHACGRVLARRRALVLGSRGAIGSWLVRFLSERLDGGTSQVAGIDLVAPEAPDRDEAPIEVRSPPDLPIDASRDCDLWIGVTGTSVLDGGFLENWLCHGDRQELWVASGSTKTVEFRDIADWLDALKHTERPQMQGRPCSIESQEILDPITGRLFGHRHRFRLGGDGGRERTRDVCFLAHLMPINFLYYGVPTELIDLVLTTLIRSALGLVDRRSDDASLLVVDVDVDADGNRIG